MQKSQNSIPYPLITMHRGCLLRCHGDTTIHTGVIPLGVFTRVRRCRVAFQSSSMYLQNVMHRGYMLQVAAMVLESSHGKRFLHTFSQTNLQSNGNTDFSMYRVVPFLVHSNI